MAMFGALNFCADIKKYEYLVKVGQGTFGEVHKARDRENGSFVAIKKVLTDNCKEGMPITTIREVKILQQVVHENIVKLIEICVSLNSPNTKCTERNFYLVFEFCEHDLAGLLSNLEVKFSLEHIKMIMKQLLNALFFIHDKAIIHRDLKTSNVLVTKKGVLKLADFGLARVMKTRVANPTYTISVVTLWYRPPELLFKESNYTTSVDMWGAGCIMAELWTRRPILKGTCELHQLKLIIDLCGSINPDSYPGCEKIDSYNKWQLKQGERRKIKEKLQPYIEDPYALDLLDKLLCLDPASRIDSDTALNHDFFWCDPMPCELSGMLSKVNRSLFEYGIRKNGNGIAADAQRGRGQPRADDGQYHDRVF